MNETTKTKAQFLILICQFHIAIYVLNILFSHIILISNYYLYSKL